MANGFVPAPSTKPSYRAAREMLIPYYSLKDLVEAVMKSQGKDLKTWRLPIKRVLIGPSRHKELNKASVQSLLSDKGHPDPDIVGTSEIPYRGW